MHAAATKMAEKSGFSARFYACWRILMGGMGRLPDPTDPA
jgi:hypothetical protein